MSDMLRSPTFFVGAERQRFILDDFHRHEQMLAEEYQKYKPLCFNASAHQKTHPTKLRMGHRDADRTLVSPMILGVADGVSQIETFGIDASLLPEELLDSCRERAMTGLLPGGTVSVEERYEGPIPLLREAFEETECMGSTTIVLAIMDNINTQIHGKLHPMIAVITIGDCELLILRRLNKRSGPLDAIFHTEMQRIDGHCQQPLQLARVDDRIDPDFDESITVEVIERGSAVHCVSAYEGDILIMGSDGIFDNIFLDEIVEVCNEMMPPASAGGQFAPASEALLGLIAQRLVAMAHSKTTKDANGQLVDTPIGKGGKMDDTSVVVGEVVLWTEEHQQLWAPTTTSKYFGLWDFISCGGSNCNIDAHDGDAYEYDGEMMAAPARSPQKQRRRSMDGDEEDSACSVS